MRWFERAGCEAGLGLSVLAPMSGATVGVRDITVAGTVSPATATVLVGEQPADVVDGRYSRTLHRRSTAG